MNQRVATVSQRTFAAMRFRNYRLYIGSQAISFSGTWLQQVGQSWLVLQLTDSGTALGTVLAIQFLPMLTLGPWAGLLADRVDKRRLIMTTQSLAAVCAFVLGVLTVTDVVTLWMVYAVAFVFGIVNALDNPARQTFVMEMVGKETVANAVTLNSVVVNGARIVGPSIAGVLIAVVGIGQCFLVNAATYVVVVVALYAIRTEELHRSEAAPRERGQLREGFRYAWNTPAVRVTLLMLLAIGTLTYEFTVTLPLLADFTFDTGSTGLATMTALMGVGAVVGGLVTASYGNPTPRRFVMAAAAFGVLMIALAASPVSLVAYAVLPFLGAASVSVISLSNATLQLNASPLLRGRVMSLFSVTMLGSTPIGGPVVGAIAEHTNPRVSILVGAVAAIAAATYGFVRLEDRGRQRTRDPQSASPAPAPTVGQ